MCVEVFNYIMTPVPHVRLFVLDIYLYAFLVKSALARSKPSAPVPTGIIGESRGAPQYL